MQKYIFTTLLLLVVSITIAQELTVTQKVPASAAPGSDFTVETTINRGAVSGFMKFFQELPQGFTAADIDSKGGSFTFADNGAKIVWIAPPTEAIFTVSYKVTVAADASGPKILNGKLSYISNNERKVFDFETKTVNVGSGAAAVKTEAPKVTPAPPVTTSTPETTTPVATTPPSAIETTTPPVITPEKTTTPVAVATETSPKETPPVTTTPVTAPEKTATPPPVTTAVVVPKKETPSPVKIVTQSTKVPTAAAPISSAGKTYRVQIGAFNLKPTITGVPDISKVTLDNGMTKYFSGNFSSYEEASKHRKAMIDKGFQGAFIVPFENGKMVK